MQTQDAIFQVETNGQLISVCTRMIGKDTIYLLNFPDRSPSLVITLAKAEGGGNFWTSLPEGRQGEAEIFGPMIETHIKKQKQQASRKPPSNNLKLFP